ncbi:MAG: sulfotransferase domain-containing protein [Acidimicrobiia bacterium]|nr:sulfotransferase domain-containing protein [Acidimicrobiia bacterium]
MTLGPSRTRLGNARRYGNTVFHRATAPWRALPDFIVIGAHKAGTSSLYWYLTRHPQVVRARRKEAQFFGRSHERGERYYRSFFPMRRSLGGGRITGEASPGYLSQPKIPARVAGLVPDARLIALLRNPVQRAISQYRFYYSKGWEQRPLSEAIDEGIRHNEEGDDDSWKAGMLSRGLYERHLRRWYEHFDQDRLLVVKSETLFGEPEKAYRIVTDFLGLEPHGLDKFPPRNVTRPSDAVVDDESVARLEQFFSEPNERLFALLGERLW